jgi:hypothetical protein
MRWRNVLLILLLLVVGVIGYKAWGIVRGQIRQSAVPEELTTRAVVPGIPGARYWVGTDLEPFVREVIAAREREAAFLASSGHAGELPPFEVLALSGGGDDGAFGAGLLCGWTAEGDRPSFKVVTGVSTGALIAPFAFLGSEYDRVLREVYTSVKPADIARKRSILAAIDNDAMADNRPLWTLMSKYVDDAFLARIAQEYDNGRFLLVGTTNLDARQPVIWNMGAIAKSGSANALELFRSILIASAAIPGAFPPTMIPVEVDGKKYEEMHVDGGCSAQVFLYPPRLRRVAESLGETMTRQGRVYIIRNAALKPAWAAVDRRTLTITGKAISSLIYTQGVGDLYRIYLTTQRDGLDFNLAYIGPEFVYKNKKEDFETKYMVSLFNFGFALGRNGYPWQKTPPGLDAPLGR